MVGLCCKSAIVFVVTLYRVRLVKVNYTVMNTNFFYHTMTYVLSCNGTFVISSPTFLHPYRGPLTPRGVSPDAPTPLCGEHLDPDPAPARGRDGVGTGQRGGR